MSPLPSENQVDILHVEDDDTWADLVRTWMEDRGMRVHRTRSGLEMRRFLSRCEQLPRCVLLDLTLADGDGLSLCDHLKGTPRLQELPIVLLTGRSIAPVEFLKRHALYRVEKSTTTEEELAAVIEAILTQQGHTQGVLEAGDIHLYPKSRAVLHNGKIVAVLDQGPFSAFALLVRNSPIPVADERLYNAFLTRHAYETPEHDVAFHKTLRDYIYRLRLKVGPVIGQRIEKAEAGYFYILTVSI